MRSTADIEAAQAALKEAKSSYHPRINLEGALRRDDNVAGVQGNRNSDAIMVERVGKDTS